MALAISLLIDHANKTQLLLTALVILPVSISLAIDIQQ